MSEFCSRGPVWSNGTVPEGTVVGRATGGNVAALTAAEVATVVGSPSTMTMVLYEEQSDQRRRVMYQSTDTLYAVSLDSAGTVYKSTDLGRSWTTLAGALGFLSRSFLRLATGTLIAVSTSGVVKRSTDDGATWATVLTMAYPPLGVDGLCDSPSGNVVVAEYGNDGNTVYRVFTSTDDGATWVVTLSSPGTDGATDPGHIHSVVYDPYAAKLLAVMDRTHQEHYVSTDGLTWDLIGVANVSGYPNWVSPMFFPTHIAWGYDDANNGKFARIPRADYYSGNWAATEVVTTQFNPKPCYHTFPVREGVWIATNTLDALGTQPEGMSSYALEHYIIYDNGSKVAGGFAHVPWRSKMGLTTGITRTTFPNRNHATLEQHGLSWLNLDAGAIVGTTAAVPYSVGYGPVMDRTAPARRALPSVIKNAEGIYALQSDGDTASQVVTYDVNNRLVLKNPYVAASAMPEMRLYESSFGAIRFLIGGTVGFSVEGGGAGVAFPRIGGSAGPVIRTGAGSPEGIVTAPVASLYLRSDGATGTCLYVKESGTGNAGWVAK